MQRVAGQLLDGRYALEWEIAAGGMGRVFAATQTNLDRPVAVKTTVEASDDLRRRFILEAKALARVNHPNVVTIHDCGEAHDGTLFLVMEFLRGTTLAEHLRNNVGGPMAPADALEMCVQLARGLRAVHRQSIVHRDIKPSNVFVVDGEDGATATYKLFDFGIVKADETLTRKGVIVGTPAFMAPEQIAGAAVDARTDLYSLGVLVYQAVCGAPLFPEARGRALFDAHMHLAPLPPSARGVSIATAFEEIILALLEKRPEDRFATCDELLAALDDVCALPLPVLSRAPPLPKAPAPPALPLDSTVTQRLPLAAFAEALPRTESPSPLTPAYGVDLHALAELPRTARVAFADLPWPKVPAARDVPADLPLLEPLPLAAAPRVTMWLAWLLLLAVAFALYSAL